MLIYVKKKKKKKKLITSCFVACVFASIIAQDTLNTLLKSLAIIEVQSEEQVLLLMLLLNWKGAF